jgi:DNA-binding IclR family transcriptional regulator
LEKGLDIIELLAREPESISLKEIADRLGRSVGEIFRMLAVLEQRGYVRSGEDVDRYELSMRLFRLAHWHLPVNRLTRAASGPMRRLSLHTGQSCHLTILSGSRSVVIAKHDSFRDRNFSMRVGAESPIFSSCSGRIFYALLDHLMRETLLAHISAEGGDIAEARLVRDLEPKIKDTGLLEIPSDIVKGILDIGTPIYDHDRTVCAALVIPFLHRVDKDKTAQLPFVRAALLDAGHAITDALSGTESDNIRGGKR